MLYSVDIRPQLSAELASGIDAIRKAYDPSWGLIDPHVGICFPPCNTLDLDALSRHVEQVVSRWNPFAITLGGFHKTPDHWLLITLLEGADKIKQLRREMYTGYLAPYQRQVPGAVPHIGLGLFLKEGCRYNYRNPQESEFDLERYEEGLRLAESLPLPFDVPVDRVHITAIPDVVAEYTTGRRDDLPAEAKMPSVREFRLGARK